MKSKIRFIIIIILFSTHYLSFAQINDTINQYDSHGLKIGYWQREHIFQGEELVTSGIYITVPDTNIQNDSTKNLCMKSVEQGRWISIRKNPGFDNDTAQIYFYDKGHLIRQRRITPIDGHELFDDYTNVYIRTDNMRRTDTFLAKDTTIIESYTPGKGYTYYPNRKLEFSDIVLSPHSLYYSPDTVFLTLRAKDKVLIDSITTSNNYLSFFHNNDSAISKILLYKNQIDSIGIVYSPIRTIRERKTTFKIHSSNGDFLVFLWLNASDINKRNFDKVETLYLTQSDNLKLYIERLGWHTFWRLYDESEGDTLLRGYSHDTGDTGPLELSGLKAGNYNLRILNDDKIRKIKIVIE